MITLDHTLIYSESKTEEKDCPRLSFYPAVIGTAVRVSVNTAAYLDFLNTKATIVKLANVPLLLCSEFLHAYIHFRKSSNLSFAVTSVFASSVKYTFLLLLAYSPLMPPNFSQW